MNKPMLKLRLLIFLLVMLLASISSGAMGQSVIHRVIPPDIDRLGLSPIGRLDSTIQMTIVFALPARNFDELRNLVAQISNPLSPIYHRYLTIEQLNSRFSPTESDYQAVISFVSANHLSVTETFGNRLILCARASVVEIERTLHVTMYMYNHPTEHRTFYAPDREPSVDLNVTLLSIGGLESYALSRPCISEIRNLGAEGFHPNSIPAQLPGTLMGSDFRKAYAPGVSLTGFGQKVGLVEFDGFILQDILDYESLAGISPTVSIVWRPCGGNDDTLGESNGRIYDQEVCMDIETVISMAPGLAAVNVYGGGDLGGSTGDWERVMGKIVDENSCSVVSSSWTIVQPENDPAIEQDFIWMQGQGQSFLQASGDGLAYTGPINFPCDDTNITVVGGTTLSRSYPSGAYISEKVWNSGTTGSAGGSSTVYTIPAWQRGTSMSSNGGSITMRNIPDVALVADSIYVREGQNNYRMRGTSAAAPLWAGFLALVNQQLTANGQPPTGFLNPVIYQIGNSVQYPGDIHDILPPGTNGAFNAVQGYDLCTGWGTPNGQALINALVHEAPLFAWADSNKSYSSTATASSSQRKLYRESSGKLHEVFESGGEIFYRNTTNGGQPWSGAVQLSDGSRSSSAPCITMSSTLLLVVWQQLQTSYSIVYTSSTNGGTSWISPTTLATSVSCAQPGPITTVSGYSDGTAFVEYRSSVGMRYLKSANSGSSWTGPTAVPNSTANWNSPSSGIFSTYWSTPQANIAYATDISSGSPRIHYNYYDVQANSWGSPIDLTNALTSEYANHQNPNIAVEVDDKTMHVVWDAVDTYNPGTRVIFHMKGSFRAIGSTYSILQYQGQDEPSITGLTQDRAWIVFQNQAGGNSSIWKQYYNGSSWQGYYGTVVGIGHDPQISVGSTSAEYIWTQGVSSPFQINIGSETLSKSSIQPSYTRALNFIDENAGASVSIELGGATIVHVGGYRDSIGFEVPPPDTTLFNATSLLDAGTSEGFTLPSDADSLIIPCAFYGNNPQTLFGNAGGSLALTLTDKTGFVIGRFGNVSSTSILNGKKQMFQLAVSLQSLALSASGTLMRIKPEMQGLRSDLTLTESLGHIYSGPGALSLSRTNGTLDRGSSILPVPTKFELSPNYPNPFNPSTKIDYQLAASGEVSLTVLDLLGREVANLVTGSRKAGYYTANWNASSFASGVYYVRLVVTYDGGVKQFTKVNKVLLLK